MMRERGVKSMTIRKYITSDLYRLWVSKKWITGILITYVALMLNSFLWGKSLDVLLIFWGIRTFSTIVLSYIGPAYCFSISLAEDFEHRFHYAMIGRGDVYSYSLSKVIVCFLSAVLSCSLGYLLFVFTYSFRYPLCDMSSPVTENYVMTDLFGVCIEKGHVVLFFFLSATLTGMLAGILSVMAMFFSLYVKSKIMVLCMPMMLHYFVQNYLGNWLNLPGFLCPVTIYASEVGAFDSNLLSLLYAIGIALLSIGAFSILIMKSVVRRL